MSPDEQQKELQASGLGNPPSTPTPVDPPPRPLCVGFTAKTGAPAESTVRGVIGGEFEMLRLPDGRQMLAATAHDPGTQLNTAATRYAGKDIFGNVVILEPGAQWPTDWKPGTDA